MKIGFFGGSFNPPTIAHYNLIKQAKEAYNFDIVYFVPVNDYYNKKNLISIDKRIEMLKILCQKEKNIQVLEIEKNIDKKLDAIDIFRIIEKEYKNNDVYFFMGEDNYKKMYTWKSYDELKKYKYIVFQRSDKSEYKINNKNIIYMKNSENLKISSSIIREKINRNEDISILVSKEIENYIKENNLYKPKENI